MKKLPIGIQSIEKIRTQDYIYVDKTQFALELIEGDAPHYFLSRPRRFGKSLFLSTLAEIFKGNKELFKECHIHESNYDWKHYSVLYLNFGAIANDTTEALKTDLNEALIDIAHEQGIEIHRPSVESQLKALVKALAKKGKVVILIDEYDKPLIDNLHRLEVAEGNRELLQSFYSTLKSLDEHIKFTFITGISRFSKVSLFSGANHLKDISMDKRYADMMGYTYDEIVQYFDEHLQAIAQEQDRTEEEVLTEIKTWYNGYRFTKAETHVYNPFSTLNYLDEREIKSYWYASGTPTFLLEQVKKHPRSMVPLSGTRAKESTLTSSGSVEEIDLKALMFQTGYLTIEGYSPSSKHYQLGFPNQEVREAFTDSLVKHFAKLDDTLSATMEAALEQHQLTFFFERIQQLIAGFPHQLFTKSEERIYHGFVLSLLSGMGLEVAAETPGNLGRLDLLVQVSGTTYIIELKLDKSPEQGIEQIREKQYYLPYLHQGQKLALVGLNFSSSARNIASWSGELLDEQGKLIQALVPESKQ